MKPMNPMKQWMKLAALLVAIWCFPPQALAGNEGANGNGGSAPAAVDASGTKGTHAGGRHPRALRAAAPKDTDAIREQCQPILEKALAEAQAQHGKDVAELRQCVEGLRKQIILWGVVGFCAIAAIALVILCFTALIYKKSGAGILYCIEVVLLVAVLVLISMGTFHLMSRIVDRGTNGCAVHAITSPDCNGAVLQAYEQLSNEMARWAALFGILGAFFGLVLPAGAYLLQLKAVEREEVKTAENIRKKLAGFGEEVKRMLENAKRDMDEKVDEKTREMGTKMEEQVAEIWEEYSSTESLKYMQQFQYLWLHKPAGDSVSNQDMMLWTFWITSLCFFVQTFRHVRNNDSVQAKLDMVIHDIEKVLNRADFNLTREKFTDGQNTTFNIRGRMNDLKERFPEKTRKLEELLGKCGIVVGQKK